MPATSLPKSNARNSSVMPTPTDADWAVYLATRKARIHSQPGLLQALRVETTAIAHGAAGAERQVAIDLAPLKQRPIEPLQVANNLNQVEANGSYEAAFDTFTSAASTSEATPKPAPAQSPFLIPAFWSFLPGSATVRPSSWRAPMYLLQTPTSRAPISTSASSTRTWAALAPTRGDLRLGFLTQAWRARPPAFVAWPVYPAAPRHPPLRWSTPVAQPAACF